MPKSRQKNFPLVLTGQQLSTRLIGMSNKMNLSPKMIATLVSIMENGGGVRMVTDANIERALRRRGLLTDTWENAFIEGKFRFNLTEEGQNAARAATKGTK